MQALYPHIPQTVIKPVQPLILPATGFFKRVFYDLQEFMFTNNVLVIATGWGIGTATKDIVHRLLDEVFVPILKYLSKFSLIQYVYNRALVYAAETKLEKVLLVLGNITWDFFVWITVIILTFFLLEYVLYRRIIGLKSSVKSDAKIEFAKSKAAAKEEGLIPNRQDLEILDKKIKFEEKAGETVLKDEQRQIKSQIKPTTLQQQQPVLMQQQQPVLMQQQQQQPVLMQQQPPMYPYQYFQSYKSAT